MKRQVQPQDRNFLAKLPRCQAKSKTSGKQCRQPAMKGKRVCYYHGGMSPGAPKGNKNALKHGRYSIVPTWVPQPESSASTATAIIRFFIAQPLY